MAIASSLDFYETKFRENSVTFSEVFGIKALIKRVENGFEFGADQSYGDMVEDYLHKSVKSLRLFFVVTNYFESLLKNT